MENQHDVSAGETLDNWFRGQASDEDLIAHFMPRTDHSPLERLRRTAQAMNLGQQIIELSRQALLLEAQRTADAIEMASAPADDENSLAQASKLALGVHFDALQLMAEAFEDADVEKVIDALSLAEQAEATMRQTQRAVGLVKEHLQRIP